MKNTKIEISDKKFVFHGYRMRIFDNIFTAVYKVQLEELELNTFWKRLKWLLNGKIK